MSKSQQRRIEAQGFSADIVGARKLSQTANDLATSITPEDLDRYSHFLKEECIAYLRARGYECLRRHDGVPVENGEYLVRLTTINDHEYKWWAIQKVDALNAIQLPGSSVVVALGPLPNNEEK